MVGRPLLSRVGAAAVVLAVLFAPGSVLGGDRSEGPFDAIRPDAVRDWDAAPVEDLTGAVLAPTVDAAHGAATVVGSFYDDRRPSRPAAVPVPLAVVALGAAAVLARPPRGRPARRRPRRRRLPSPLAVAHGRRGPPAVLIA